MPALAAALRARPPLAAALLVLAVLAATTDERSFGVIPDGREMLSAGAAAAFSADLGVSRDFANAVPRGDGDAWLRYGAGQSLVQVPVFWAARLLHTLSPRASSAPLFVLLQILLLSAAAGGVASAAGRLGASAAGQLFAGVALVVSTPLWAYAGSDFSEPLQAALVTLAVAALAAHRAAPSRKSALFAGAVLGSLPLAKSLLWLAALPLLAAALAAPGPAPDLRRRRVGGCAPSFIVPLALGAAAPLASWLLLELVRFGRPFGGYPGEDFSYPFLTGLLRLVLLPNKGLLFYAPVALLAVPGTILLARRDRPFAIGLSVAALALLASAASWWAWDGQAAWGPRLLLPALPPALVAAAFAFDRGRLSRVAGLTLGAAGAAVGLVGVLQPFPPVYALATTAAPQPIAGRRAAGTRYEVERSSDGRLVATAPHHLSLTPSWWPPLVHARLLRERARGGDVGRRLEAGSLGFAPPLVPALPRHPSAVLTQAVSAFSWPFWGRSWLSPARGGEDPFSVALLDQAVRDLDAGRIGRARRRLKLLLERAREPADARVHALAADAARTAGDSAEADRLVSGSGDPCHPWIVFVRSARGEDASACVPVEVRSAFLSGVASARERGLSVSEWAREARRAAGGG